MVISIDRFQIFSLIGAFFVGVGVFFTNIPLNPIVMAKTGNHFANVNQSLHAQRRPVYFGPIIEQLVVLGFLQKDVFIDAIFIHMIKNNIPLSKFRNVIDRKFVDFGVCQSIIVLIRFRCIKSPG